jgi:predicted RNase H-like HicB family nuclease
MTIYFAKLHKNNQYEVTFPDLEPYAATYGDNLKEAIKNAHDALTGYLLTSEDYHEKVNKPSDPSKLKIGKNDFLTPVQVDLKLEREKEQNKLVKKSVTIPAFLNDLGKDHKINFSAVLTEALKKELNA